MSTKELVIELRIPLPDDRFAQAEISLKGPDRCAGVPTAGPVLC